MENSNHQKISVAGLLIIDQKALLIRRSKKETYLPGIFEIPGGKVEFGENPNVSVVREFKEEVDLSITPVIPFRVFDYVTKEGKRHTVEIVYLVKLNHDENIDNLKLSDAHDQVKWISKEDIDNIVLNDEVKADLVEGFEAIEKLI